MKTLEEHIESRRTFGIISHPDAGKTTLTEKLLLFGGAIHIAGAIKAKKASRHTTSDFMEIEKQRGISVATSVMGFNYKDIKINLLDTPGHKDFSEDTYRTLTAVDSSIMVIDSTKGVETQTYKLMEVCRMRNTPIITFINKCDREGKSPIELLDEIEEKLQLQVCPFSWPIGTGSQFKGVYNFQEKSILLFNPHKTEKDSSASLIKNPSKEKLISLLGESDTEQLLEDIELITEMYPPLNKEDYLNATTTPLFFGSALNNFGVKELLEGFLALSPTPKERETKSRNIKPSEKTFSGFIFKIHANMDPKHRDRIAFLRICSGTFERGKKYHHVRLNKGLKFSNPTAFMAQEKSIVDTAYPGDIIGLHDTGNLRIGDTLTEGECISFIGIPHFSPEIFNFIINLDPLKSKQLNKGLEHLCEEGVAQLFTRSSDSKKIIGVVGSLQFEVIEYRLKNEYNASCRFENLNFSKAVWVQSKSPTDLDTFIKKNPNNIAYDQKENPVYLAETQWGLDREIKENPDINFKFSNHI
ncbi:peptide chain release factor 3 [Candidatus Marinamargulisbacteria bacterium SCGC AG-343-D04]|nr:peptide chain release factor 3 [Candidatus Marinamargulisbacteria bacterium SCGC AG-343-D04]